MALTLPPEEFTWYVRPLHRGADIGGTGGVEGPDGAVDHNNYVVFLDWFFRGFNAGFCLQLYDVAACGQGFCGGGNMPDPGGGEEGSIGGEQMMGAAPPERSSDPAAGIRVMLQQMIASEPPGPRPDIAQGMLNALPPPPGIRRVVKWGVARQLVPASVLEGLKALEPLKFGRCEARETEPVKPVAAEVVETTKRAAPPTLAMMIELHQLSGMRPGELVIMRGCDIERAGKSWRYTPSSHKTEHYGCTRTISLGPKAQAILLPLLKDDPQAFIFSSEKVLEERRRLSRKNRRTPITPSERARQKKQQPKRKPGWRYTVMSYARAVAYACDMAYPHPELSGLRQSKMTVEQRAELEAWRAAHRWSPNQLRHSAATAIRKKFGIEAARVVLGHSSASTTEIYAELDAAKAAEVMGSVG